MTHRRSVFAVMGKDILDIVFSPSTVSMLLSPIVLSGAFVLLSTTLLSTFYVALALLTAIGVGISLVSTLLVEEKEWKTLRMLLVSPASLTDIVVGKLLVGVTYQLLVSLAVMALLHGFVGNLPLVLLFVLLSTAFGLSLGLLAGSVFQTTSGLGGFLSIVSALFAVSAVFASSLAAVFTTRTSLVEGIIHLLPTYYMAEGLLNALQNQSTSTSVLLDLSVTIGGTLVCLVAAVWILHRQTAVTASV